MTIIYRTTGPWGAGKGANLTPAEVDGNFHDLAGRVVALEGADFLGTKLSNVTGSGRIVTFHLSDGTQRSFTMPIAVFNPRGAWQPGTSYASNDIVTEDGEGTFVVLVAHISDTAFDAAATDGSGNPLYGQLFLPPRAAGSLLNGAGAPSAGLGIDGDFYIDTAADDIYGPKTAGAWGSATSLVGPPGDTGATGATGAQGPAGAGSTIVVEGSGAVNSGIERIIFEAADFGVDIDTAGIFATVTSRQREDVFVRSGSLAISGSYAETDIVWQSREGGDDLGFTPAASMTIPAALDGRRMRLAASLDTDIAAGGLQARLYHNGGLVGEAAVTTPLASAGVQVLSKWFDAVGGAAIKATLRSQSAGNVLAVGTTWFQVEVR